jgi:hypothetical protein
LKRAERLGLEVLGSLDTELAYPETFAKKTKTARIRRMELKRAKRLGLKGLGPLESVGPRVEAEKNEDS